MNKRVLSIVLVVIGLLFFVGGVGVYYSLSGELTWDIIVVVIIVVLFLAYAIPRYIINRHDKVDQDEFSKKTLRIAASRSYYISLYTWLALMIFDDIFEETSTQIGLGIAIMAVLFLVNVIVVKYSGVRE